MRRDPPSRIIRGMAADRASSDLTARLDRLVRGDRSAADSLMPVIQAELHRVARALMAGQRPGHTLQPTALVHEAWLRLVGPADASVPSRSHFFALAARAMRSVLVDHARRRCAGKRGSARLPVSLDFVDLADRAVDPSTVLDLDQALERLAAKDPDLGRLVELLAFGGLSQPECAEVLQISLSSVERNWRLARAWLRAELEGPATRDSSVVPAAPQDD